MELTQARDIAESLVEQMRPYCVKCEVAGSIRRGKSEVKDIEICAVPKWEQGIVSTDLFGTTELLNSTLVWAFDAAARGDVRWIKPGTSEIIDWEPKRDGKYWRGLLPSDIKLDLFLAQEENFGAIFLIRTGCAEFSQAVVTHAKRIGRPCVDGFFTADGQPLETPSEKHVFDILDLYYVRPEERTGAQAVRPVPPDNPHSYCVWCRHTSQCEGQCVRPQAGTERVQRFIADMRERSPRGLIEVPK